MSTEQASQGLRVLRQKQILEKFGISASTLWQWVKAGRFPKPVAVGPNTVVWLQDEIDALLIARAKERRE
jgi:prophage regulatory protein